MFEKRSIAYGTRLLFSHRSRMLGVLRYEIHRTKSFFQFDFMWVRWTWSWDLPHFRRWLWQKRFRNYHRICNNIRLVQQHLKVRTSNNTWPLGTYLYFFLSACEPTATGPYWTDFSYSYLPSNVLSDDDCEDWTEFNYWILPDGMGEQYLTVDRGCKDEFNVVAIKNTHHGSYNNRCGMRWHFVLLHIGQ